MTEIKISRDRITKLKDIEEDKLNEFKEEELIKIASALGFNFEDLFIKDII